MPSIDFEARRPWFRERLDALAESGALVLLVLEPGTEVPTGFLTLDPATGEVDQLAVDPAHAGRGAARTLMDHAKRLSPCGLHLTVNVDNPRALRFYERAGFAVTGQGTNPRSGLPVRTMSWRASKRHAEAGCQESAADVRTPHLFKEPPMHLPLSAAQALATAALSHARDKGMKPLVVVVLDGRGAVKAALAEDGASLKRFEIAHGKAHGALSLGIGSRSIAKRALEQAFFVAAVTHVVGGSLVPVPGGVLLKDEAGAVIGAAGASGDTSDNDEAAVLAGIAAAGLKGDPGQD